MSMEFNPAERLGKSQEDLDKAQKEHSESLDKVDEWVDSGELAKEFGEAKADLIRKRYWDVIEYFEFARDIKKGEEWLATTINVPPSTTRMAAQISEWKIKAQEFKDDFENIKPVQGEQVEPLATWPDYEAVAHTIGYTGEDRDILENNDVRALGQKGGKWFILDSGLQPIREINLKMYENPHKKGLYNLCSFEWKDEESGKVTEIIMARPEIF